MDTPPADAFAQIITLARTVFENVGYREDYTTERAILRLQAEYRHYRIFVVELFSEGIRKYRYYVLQGEWVEAGFDNDPDPRAIRLKYGKIGRQHAGEAVPHIHRADKTELMLTEEMTFETFVEWLRENLLR